jgi:hypothetical protein
MGKKKTADRISYQQLANRVPQEPAGLIAY